MPYRLRGRRIILTSHARCVETVGIIPKHQSIFAELVLNDIRTEDLNTPEEAQKVIYALSQDIGARLRAMNLRARGVHLSTRDNTLNVVGWQTLLSASTQDESTIATEAFKILERNYSWQKPLRSLTVTAINLESDEAPTQLSLLDSPTNEKRELLTRAIDEIHTIFGKDSLVPAIILDEQKMPHGTCDNLVMPGWMYV